MTHELKINRKYLEDVKKGYKSFEVRKNDRDFCLGDILALNEFENCKYTGRCIFAVIEYIFDDSSYCKDGYVILGIKPINLIYNSGKCNIYERQKTEINI